MKESIQNRVFRVVKELIPSTLRTAWWIIKLTVSVSFAMMILDYTGVLAIVSRFLAPVFGYFGLPGAAALSFLTGFFVNVYSAIAVMASLSLDWRAITILSVMVLCAHNMITETAVQHKTGSSWTRIFCVRTFSALILGFVLNLILPGTADIPLQTSAEAVEHLPFWTMLGNWALATIKLIIKMLLIIVSLSIVQRLLSEFGIIRWIGRLLKPLLAVFGLPANTGFLWIVANFLGLAYGAAIMMDERRTGHVSLREADLLNHHICIAHSNVEDVILLGSVGAGIPVMLLSRWALALILVWERRLESLFHRRLTKDEQKKAV